MFLSTYRSFFPAQRIVVTWYDVGLKLSFAGGINRNFVRGIGGRTLGNGGANRCRRRRGLLDLLCKLLALENTLSIYFQTRNCMTARSTYCRDTFRLCWSFHRFLLESRNRVAVGCDQDELVRFGFAAADVAVGIWYDGMPRICTDCITSCQLMHRLGDCQYYTSSVSSIICPSSSAVAMTAELATENSSVMIIVT